MTKYEIDYTEVRDCTIVVEAESEEEAQQKFFRMHEHGIDDDDLEYVSDLLINEVVNTEEAV